jgi:hypothetical protein
MCIAGVHVARDEDGLAWTKNCLESTQLRYMQYTTFISVILDFKLPPHSERCMLSSG